MNLKQYDRAMSFCSNSLSTNGNNLHEIKEHLHYFSQWRVALLVFEWEKSVIVTWIKTCFWSSLKFNEKLQCFLCHVLIISVSKINTSILLEEIFSLVWDDKTIEVGRLIGVMKNPISPLSPTCFLINYETRSLNKGFVRCFWCFLFDIIFVKCFSSRWKDRRVQYNFPLWPIQLLGSLQTNLKS